MICTFELSFLERSSNEIEEVYFCYFVSQNAQCDVDNASSSHESSSAVYSFSLPPSQLFLNNVIVKQPANATSLQQLLQEFNNVFPNELPEGLPPE